MGFKLGAVLPREERVYQSQLKSWVFFDRFLGLQRGWPFAGGVRERGQRPPSPLLITDHQGAETGQGMMSLVEEEG